MRVNTTKWKSETNKTNKIDNNEKYAKEKKKNN